MLMVVGPYRQLDTAGSLALARVVKFAVLQPVSLTGCTRSFYTLTCFTLRGFTAIMIINIHCIRQNVEVKGRYAVHVPSISHFSALFCNKL